MSNPKVRSLGRRGGQQEGQSAANNKSSHGFQADDETKSIVKSLFEEYASEDGKNFYTGSKDEKSEKEHEEFLNEIDKKLNENAEYETVYESDDAKAAENEVAAELEVSENTEAAAEKDNAYGEAKDKKDKKDIKKKRVSVIRAAKKAEPDEEDQEKLPEDEPKSEDRKKRKAAVQMKRRSKPKKEEYYEEYEDVYENDEYEDEYDDGYEDEYGNEYEDEYEDDNYDDKSGGGVEFSLKMVGLVIALVIVLLIITALFINNRSLSHELEEQKAKNEEQLQQYSQQVEQLNQKISELTNPEVVTAEGGNADKDSEGSTSKTSNSSEDSDSSEGSADDYYVVQPGDTLYKIASSQLGDKTKYNLIQEANNMGSSTNLTIGQKLKMPKAD